jgi:hypothetical protein
MQMGIEVLPEAASINGPVKVHQSSEIAERAWCDTCGSAVWFRYTHGSDAGYFELAPGLFENAGDAMLVREVYADKCPSGYALAGNHLRISKADYETDNPFVGEGKTNDQV